MDCTISVQPTPNPNALKFILNVPVKTKDSAVYRQFAECKGNDMASAILKLDYVTEVYFAANFITVTQTGAGDWDKVEARVKETIQAHITRHDPNFEAPGAAPVRPEAGGEIGKVEEILESTIRPALQRDGGDLQVVGIDGKTISIRYEGACGCCPHAAMGTLYAIQNILRDRYDPEVVVQMV
ncbi:MAG: NifU family protein [Elusimicrobia bacterium]|nr:NifU family protein [Elusimicrobiota bacterium]